MYHALMQNGNPIGTKIKARREELGITQETLSRVAQVDGMTVRRVEAGNHEPSIRILRKLATALNVPIAYFFI